MKRNNHHGILKQKRDKNNSIGSKVMKKEITIDFEDEEENDDTENFEPNNDQVIKINSKPT